jgi:5'-3' exonuclease
MGIPLYFKKVSTEFTDIISSKQPYTKCDRLFLDFNCAIHRCCNELKTQLELDHQVTDAEFEDMLIARCKVFIAEIYELVKPTELIYVAIDGVVPMAKIQQQRKRRYLRDWREGELAKSSRNGSKRRDGHTWNTNAITPGTSFMQALVLEISAFTETFSKSHDIRTITTYEKGEGEHNIYRYICKTDDRRAYTDVIYGLDADMILLSMLMPSVNKTFLIREDVNDVSNFIYMDIHNTRSQIVKQFADITDTNTNTSVLLKSYIFLTFLLGNDFVPNLTYLSLRTNGLSTMLSMYTETYLKQNNGRHIINVDNTINTEFLSMFIEALARDEDTAFADCEKKYYDTKLRRTHYTYEEKKLDNYPLIHKYPEIINVDTAGWRRYYYYYLFDKSIRCDVISQSCIKYLIGLQWLVDYYFNKKTDWYWCYPYSYSPTILDLSNYINSIDHYPSSLTHGYRSINALDQLLMVLPTSSKHLIPCAEYRSYYTDVNKGYVHCFPTSICIVTYMKYQLHECDGFGLALKYPLLI